MKHIILTLTFLLFSTLGFGQKKVQLLDFLDDINVNKSESYFLKKYKKNIVNEVDSIPDLHSATGNWYLNNVYVKSVESLLTSIKFEEEDQSITLTSIFGTSNESSSLFYDSIINKWGEAIRYTNTEKLEILVPEFSEFGPGKVYFWYNGNDELKILAETFSKDGYILIYTTSPSLKNIVEDLESKSIEEIKSYLETNLTPKVSPINPIFFNTLSFGQDISEKDILDAFLIATKSQRIEDVVNHTIKNISSEHSYSYTIALPINYLGIDWETTSVLSSNNKLLGINFTLSNIQSHMNLETYGDQLLKHLLKKYGSPSQTKDKVYSWEEKDSDKSIMLAINSNLLMFGCFDISCNSLEPINVIKPIQTRFFDNLKLGAPIFDVDVENIVKNASRLFLNNKGLYPGNFISKDKISWDSMSYVITTPITFAGDQWDFVILRVEEAKLASIEFQKSSPRSQKSSINDDFAYWKDALIGKYGLFTHIPEDNLSSGIYLWKDSTSSNYLTLEKTISTSKGGEMRCYLKLIYSNQALVNKQTNSIQEEF